MGERERQVQAVLGIVRCRRTRWRSRAG